MRTLFVVCASFVILVLMAQGRTLYDTDHHRMILRDDSMKFVIQIALDSIDYAYAKRDSGYYHLSHFSAYVKTTFITGFGKMDGKSQTNRRNDSPDTSAGEFSRIKFIHQDGRWYEAVESLNFQSGQPLRVMYDAEVELVEGQWEDMDNGKDVAFRYTESGLDVVRRFYSESLSTGFADPLTKAFKDRLRKKLAGRGVDLSEEELEEVMQISLDAKVEVVSLPNPARRMNHSQVWSIQNEPIIVNVAYTLVANPR